jgi:hypothetical protein
MLDDQSTGTTESAGDAGVSGNARVSGDAEVSGNAEITALANRVATARSKLPLQTDPALLAELSEAEIAAERELAEWIRAQQRRQRRRAVSAELAAEKRDRRVALQTHRADDADARWHRRALAARRRVSSPDARLAQLYRRAEWSSRALIGVVVLGMVWAGVNVQHNLVPSGDMSDPLYWLSYGFEAMISVPIITIMVVATTAARWGREIARGKVVFLEVALLGVTIALNAGPHLAAHAPARAAEAAVAPVMVGAVIWLHAWVSARYAQLIEGSPVDRGTATPGRTIEVVRSDGGEPWTAAGALRDGHANPRPTMPAIPDGVMRMPSAIQSFEHTGSSHPAAAPAERNGSSVAGPVEPGGTAYPISATAPPDHNRPTMPVGTSPHRNGAPYLATGQAGPGDSAHRPAATAAADDISRSHPAAAVAERNGSPIPDPVPNGTTYPLPAQFLPEHHMTSNPLVTSTSAERNDRSYPAVSEPTGRPAVPDPGRGQNPAAPAARREPSAADPAQVESAGKHPESIPASGTAARSRARNTAHRPAEAKAPAEPRHTRRPTAATATNNTAATATNNTAATATNNTATQPVPGERPKSRTRETIERAAQLTLDEHAAAEAGARRRTYTLVETAPEPVEAAVPEETWIDDSDGSAAEPDHVEVQAVAREISERGLSKLPVEQLAEVLTLADESWTPAAIGAAIGLSGSRVLGILEAARRIHRPYAISG